MADPGFGYRVASLGMYDWPEVASANDAIWAFVRTRLRQDGIECPQSLDRSVRYFEIWRQPSLLLAQTCGYPFATELRGKVQLVATPCYDAPGCEGSNYCSVIIASRRSGIASLATAGGTTAAINSEHSQSGHWALRAAIAMVPGGQPPRRAVLSGGHRESLGMVAGGTADIAAIDAVCWALALRYEPAAVAKVRVIAQSPMAPGLPLITGLATAKPEVVRLRQALRAAVSEPSLSKARKALFLTGLEDVPEANYDRILGLKQRAAAMPFPALEA